MPTHTACPPPPPPDFESSSRGPRVTQSMGYPPPPEPLRCPRCDSDNTKFCYYNNYNMAQPRHHCKSCRRYWTHGGSLRDIPVGGGTRRNYTTKNNNNSNSNKKKPKLSHHQHHPASSSGESSSTASLPSSSVTHDTTAGPTKEVEKSVLTSQQLVNLDRSIAAATNVGFSSLMMMTDNSSSQVDPTSGFLSLGYGPGPVHGFLRGFGYGASRAALVWDFPVGGVSFADLNDNSVRPAAAVCSGFDTWRVGGDREVVRGDWPETVVEEKVADSSSTELPCLNFPPF